MKGPLARTVKMLMEVTKPASSPRATWCNEVLKSAFRLSQFMPGICILKTISSLNDYGKRKKTPKNGYLDSPRPLLP